MMTISFAVAVVILTHLIPGDFEADLGYPFTVAFVLDFILFLAYVI